MCWCCAYGLGQYLKTFPHFILREGGRSFVALIPVLVVDGSMVLTRVFAALHHHQDQIKELRVGVVGVIDMGR